MTQPTLGDISNLNEPRSSHPRKRHCLSNSQTTSRDSSGRPDAVGDPGIVASQWVSELRTSSRPSDNEGKKVVLPPQPAWSEPSPATDPPPAMTPTVNTMLIIISVHELSCGLCGEMLKRVGGVVRHFKIRHNLVKVLYKCSSFGRSGPSSHAISCHVPKCNSVVETWAAAAEAFACEYCPKSFGSGVGLSQHKWHVHLALYCQQKTEGARATMEKWNGGRKNVKGWTEWEEQEMDRRYKLFEGHKYIHSRVVMGLPGSTKEQVRDKRRCLRKAAMQNDGPEEAPVANNEFRWLSNPGEPPPSIHGVVTNLELIQNRRRGQQW